MRVYHGSLSIVEKPDLNILNFKTDFGRGFYTTTDYEQAKKWTNIKRKRLLDQNSSNKEIKRYINIFEFDEIKELKVLNFEVASKEWLDFIIKNRNSDMLTHDFDLVKGPVANDNLYATINLYSRKYISLEETIKMLKTYKLANQISFHTEKALNCLKYIETEELSDDE